ncbi:cation-independent mannose-6-phosphate receptor isoform X2 [Denticeps clupeoides]|uniref:cation-independent mannose-6-phosphate receptor isoform X2 n=1 Tax=Denticeps clupeoides TaxID=299321 RepID=UPI0010A2DD7D|nr:cation-independent mannose-6-phosphate receptor isoform X2 [Denticeps clupeoides]
MGSLCRSWRPAPGCLAALLLVVALLGARASGGSLWYEDLCRYKWEVFDKDSGVKYALKLCDSSPDTECGAGVAVCAREPAGEAARSVGSLSLQKLSASVVDFNTTLQCDVGKSLVQSSISFQCGKTMGTPELVTVSECTHYFEWRSYVACKKDKFKPHKEVPCYVFDSDGRKHDLSPLIKLTDGYLVDDSDDDVDFYINLCRSLNRPQSACPEGSAACLTTSKGSFNMGFPSSPPELVSRDRLQLRYEGVTDIPEFCSGHSPAVTITLICPSRRQSGSSPKMTAKTNCRYEVQWVTEYACHRDYVESHTCKLTSEQHDISIDLTHLALASGDHPYYAESTDGQDTYVYYLNVCGDVPVADCSDEQGHVAACQVKQKGSSFKKIAGRNVNQTLRYSDGDLTLIYPGGSKCSSGFQRMTIINFECNETAENDGKGHPVFTGETDCTYYFDWQTAFACVKEKEDLLCRVTDGKKRYDLSPLTRFSESDSLENWEAVDGNAPEYDRMRFYLNVCHKVLQHGAASGCPEEAGICAVGKDQQQVSLGKFLSSPQITGGTNVRLTYTDGDVCRPNMRIKTIIILKCKPGDMESPPVFRAKSSDGCIYEFEWYTSAACVLSKTEGDDCKVADPQAGFSFDLSPLRKADGGSYNMSTDLYDFFINICGDLNKDPCPTNAGACQVDKSTPPKSWSLGQYNSKLSYYDGMIQLAYRNGSTYNNAQHTQRSALISFLCDREAGAGQPEFQLEDENTYNFRWYTSYACPERPQECVVTDPATLQQYDLSSLSRSDRNWETMDLSNLNNRRKYYINVCRPLKPVPGCGRTASVCETKYELGATPTERVSVSNMGVALKGPVVQEMNHLLLEYTNGAACESDGVMTTYTTRIHLTCAKGALSSGPRFFFNQNCMVNFMWYTEAACAISTATDTSGMCTVKDPNTGFEFKLHQLSKPSGYTTTGNGKTFLLNICAPVVGCGSDESSSVAGCELEDGKPVSPVGVEKTLELSTDGQLTLTYKGELDKPTGTRDTFTISFVCDHDATTGSLKLVKEEMSSSTHVTHDAFFEFITSLACAPAPVDCQATDPEGKQYDLSDLSLDNSHYMPIDTSAEAQSQRFFINVCKPLPYIEGCPAGALGACAVINGVGVNLGYVQSSPQAASDGSIAIVYQNGDKCSDKGRYSARIMFQCDIKPGSPMFDHKDGCEYVFIWRTPKACPIQRIQGNNCKVQDPRSGHVFDLTSLSGQDYSVKSGQYDYQFSVCGPLKAGVCTHKDDGLEVASCQVEGSTHRIAGLASQTLTYENGLLMINYTNGETCHKYYKRSTVILFSCSQSQNPGTPEFIRETANCTYLFEWHTPLACLPFEPLVCSYNDGNGSSYDLSSLALPRSSWRVVSQHQPDQSYYINVCRSLFPQDDSWTCSSSSAACLKIGNTYVGLGQARSEPQLEKNVLVLRYTNGDKCPDGQRNKTTIIRFKCDAKKEESQPAFISALEDCAYTFQWTTAAACPLKTTQQDNCKVTNPVTGHQFDLSTLNKENGYMVYDNVDSTKMFRLNVCGEIKNAGCIDGAAVCIKDRQTAVNGGKSTSKLSYLDQVVKLSYEDGDVCPANRDVRHKSIISFVCKEGASSGLPVLVDTDRETCTHYFSWHTSLVCEKQISCFVWNDTKLIDLKSLVHATGSYTATDNDMDKDKSPDFYINICQPLNPIPGVTCPPGAAVCMDPDDGPPIDIGRITSPPYYSSERDEVEITFNSSTTCDVDQSQNYSSRIIFSCQRGVDLGSPQMIRKQRCVYVFEWATPVVCPDVVTTDGCSITVSQLQYTFNLSVLTGEVLVPANSGPYKINVCGTLPECNGAVCQQKSGSSVSFGNSKAVSLDYIMDDQSITMSYGLGDKCPTVEAKRQSKIIFTCDQSAGRGRPQVEVEEQGCSTTFQWRTSAACTPRKMECRLVRDHKTYDMRTLSSLTSPWKFSHGSDSYYVNLCQGIHGGLMDCPESAAICRRSKGKTQVLGLIHTQSMALTGDGKVQVNYSMGEVVCGNKLNAKTIITLSCGKVIGHPKLQREDLTTCEFWLTWETRAACTVQQYEVEMLNGTIKRPDTGSSFSLGALYFRLHKATGDIRSNGDRYVYHIQLSGITNSSEASCQGARICQVKINADFQRKIGSAGQAKYYIKGDMLDVQVPSDSKCGKDKSKTVSSSIQFHCNPDVGDGIPEFMLESDGCEYLFVWHTARVCELSYISTEEDKESDDTDAAASLSGRSQALGAVLSLLLVVLTVCLLVLLLHKRERRDLVIQKVTGCCRRANPVSYKYSKVNTDENGCEDEMEWLMEETESPGRDAHRGENGHITTKPVSADALRSFSLDEQDSEDEVLTVPGVRIHTARPAASAPRHRPALLQAESDEDLVGLLEEQDRRSRPKPHDRPHRGRVDQADDSDEDLLKV